MIVEDEIEKDFFQTKTIATFLREHCTRNDWKLTEWLKTQSKGRNNFKCHTDSPRLLSLDTSGLRVAFSSLKSIFFKYENSSFILLECQTNNIYRGAIQNRRDTCTRISALALIVYYS